MEACLRCGCDVPGRLWVLLPCEEEPDLWLKHALLKSHAKGRARTGAGPGQGGYTTLPWSLLEEAAAALWSKGVKRGWEQHIPRAVPGASESA